MIHFTSDDVEDGVIIVLGQHSVFLEQKPLTHTVHIKQYVYACSGMYLVTEDTYHDLFYHLLHLVTNGSPSSDFTDFFEHLKTFTYAQHTFSAADYTKEELAGMV